MKKIVAYILVGLLCLGAIGGLTYSLTHKKQADKPVDEVVEELSSEEALKKAEEYLKTIYKDVEKETPRDYERIGVVPIGKLKFQVTWSVDVSEEYVKIVVNENGIVTIDVNEECGEEIPYVLTATIKDEKGNIRKLTWDHVIPKKITGSYQEIVDMAYALKPGESMKNEATLQGTVTTINTPWDSGYKNITVTIVVEGREDKPIQCYRMKSGAADASKVEKGDLITVTGILKNYNGTIEFDAGCILEANEKGAGKITKVKGTYQEIVDKAYALKAGESLKGEATLQGSVTAINTAWNPDYKNITVTIVVDGRETKPIQCYRLKSGAADASKIQKGDLITVTGMLKNYNGTIEFEAGCILDENKKGAGKINTVKGSYQEIVDKAYALASGEVLAGEATLQGTVTAINTSWSSSFKNITVTIVVEGREGKPVQCYRMKSGAADASKVEKGDLITVTGILKNYNGTIEFDAGCVLDANKKGAGTINTVTGTMQDIVDKGYALEEGASLEGEATLTGSVTSVDTPYSADFKNVTVTIVVEGRESKPIKCYRMKGTNADKVAAGDKITVTGIIKNYFGTIEFDAGCVMTDWVQGGGTYEPDEPDVPVVPDEPDVPVVPGNALNDGDQIVIYAPAYNKALSATKTGNYNVGVDVTITDGVMSGYDEASTWTVIENADGTYSFANGGKNIGLAAQYTSMNLGTENDKWELIDLGDGLYNIKNVGRSTYMEWYAKYNNWSTYGANNAATDDQFQLSFYIVKPASVIQDGDQVVIYAPAYNKALSATKTGNYNVGVDVTITDGVMSGYDEASTWTVIENADGTYSFANGGKNIGLAAQYTSMNLGAVNDKWELIDLGDGLYNLKNVGRSTYMEWYAKYSNWSTYGANNAATDDQFQLSFYVLEDSSVSATLEDAVAALGAEYAEEMNVTGEYVLSPSIAINSTEFKVTWSITPTDSAVASIVDGKLVITASTKEDVEYTLTATIEDAKGNTKTWTKTSTVAKVEGAGEAKAPIADGDQIVIYAPAYNKALSATKTGNYNVGADVTIKDGVMSGYDEASTWTVIKNADGTYSFANGGKNIGLAAQYTSMNLGAVNDKWELIDLGNGLYNLKNVGRSTYMEWYAKYSNWSTYGANNAATDDQFQLSFYIVKPAPVIKNGDQVVIYAPAYNKALSATKTGNYNVGVDVTITDGVMSGYDEASTWTVIENADGTYSFANGGKNIGMAAQYTSMNLGAVNDKWELIDLGNGLYNLKNVGRSTYMEWYAKYSNWSTYGANNAATDDQFQLLFYKVTK